MQQIQLDALGACRLKLICTASSTPWELMCFLVFQKRVTSAREYEYAPGQNLIGKYVVRGKSVLGRELKPALEMQDQSCPMLKCTLGTVIHLSSSVPVVAQDEQKDVTSFTGTKGFDLLNIHHLVFTFASTPGKLWCHSENNSLIVRFFRLHQMANILNLKTFLSSKPLRFYLPPFLYLFEGAMQNVWTTQSRGIFPVNCKGIWKLIRGSWKSLAKKISKQGSFSQLPVFTSSLDLHD